MVVSLVGIVSVLVVVSSVVLVTAVSQLWLLHHKPWHKLTVNISHFNFVLFGTNYPSISTILGTLPTPRTMTFLGGQGGISKVVLGFQNFGYDF